MSKKIGIGLENMPHEVKMALLEELTDHLEQEEVIASENTPLNLHASLAMLGECYRFAHGDIVNFKPRFQGGGKPGPFVVVEVLEQPIPCPETTYTSNFFGTSFDIRLGKICTDGAFRTWLFDSRRFEPYRQTISETSKAQ